MSTKSFVIFGKTDQLTSTLSREYCDVSVGTHELAIESVGFEHISGVRVCVRKHTFAATCTCMQTRAS